MVLFVPGQGQVQELAGELIGQILADIYGHIAFEDTPRAVQQPAHHQGPEHGQKIPAGLDQVVWLGHLNDVDSLGGEVR